MPAPLRPLLALALVAPVLAACSDVPVSPLDPDAGAPFVLYGVLDPAADTQRVRLETVRRTPARPETPEPLTARLVEEGSGRAVEGRPETFPLPDGSLALRFAFALRLAPGARYRLTAEATDARTAAATTDVPPARAAVVRPAVRDTVGRYRQEVLWSGLTRAPDDVRVRYRVLAAGFPDTATVEIEEAPRGALGPDGWRTTVALSVDRATVLTQIGRAVSDTTVRLVRIEVALDERSAEWGRIGEAAPANLVGAYGFFGALGRSRTVFTPDAAVLRALGFRP